jgi:PAS domain-containing protein
VKRKFGLRAALTLLVLIAIAPVFGVLVQSSLEEQQARLLGAEASLKSLVEISAAHQEGLVEGARQMLTAMAHSPPVYGDDLQACVTYMQKLQSQFPTAYGTFGLLDDQGRLTCRATAPPNPVVASDRLFFRTAVQTGGFGVGEFIISRATGQPILTFGLPVYRDDHSLRGVAYMAMDVRRAHEHLRKLALPRGTTLLVADSNAVVIATTGDRAVDVGAKLPQQFLRQAVLDGLAHFDHGKDSDGGEWIYALRPIGQAKEGKLYVAAMVSSHDILAPGAQRLHLEIGVMALIAFVGGAAAWVFGDRVVARPIDRMLQRVNALRREETRPPDAIDSPLALFEVHELDVQFEDLARGLAERSAQRDAAMAEMLAQKNLLESILQSMAEGVLVIDSAGRFAHANSAAHRIMPAATGVNPNRSAHESAEEWDFFHLDGVTPLAIAGRPALRAIAGEDLGNNFRYIIRGRLGAEKIIQGHSRRLPSPQGDQYTAVIVFSDITADYRAEQALKDSEQRYRTLFESNPHPMWVYDVETLRFLTVNDAAVAAYGYSREEFMP